MPLAVCATPIGNLEDVTLRVLASLREADAVLCEDTRRTRVLLERHGIRARRLVSSTAQRGARGRRSCCRGSSPARRSRSSRDAGLPGVNDPGARLVAAALAAGVAGHGAAGRRRAVETALVASGLAGEQYRFLGYLPAARGGAASAVGGARAVAVRRPSRSSRRGGCRAALASSPRPSPTGRSRCAAS